ncbi:MAG: hypothetical protein COC20_04535 [Cellvibrionales bacterium]|nr:MAG: hypothetical protein COC20_04535 [Cellvibrionales bacterium]
MKILLYLTAFLFFTTGCQQYIVTFNDATVYQPPELFNDYTVADPALDTCLKQTIEDLRIYEMRKLNILRCSHADIVSTNGLNTFTHIAVLDLSNNNLINLPELSELVQLTHINLAGNKQLSCKTTKKLVGHIDQLILPEHCKD